MAVLSRDATPFASPPIQTAVLYVDLPLVSVAFCPSFAVAYSYELLLRLSMTSVFAVAIQRTSRVRLHLKFCGYYLSFTSFPAANSLRFKTARKRALACGIATYHWKLRAKIDLTVAITISFGFAR